MEQLAEQFAGALSLIEIRYDRGEEAHREVRGVLEQSPKLRDWGVNTILIGSYGRHTAISPTKDVDVFAKLEELDTGVDPDELFTAAQEVLTEYFGDRAKPQDRSIKIEYDGGFSVDAVAAVRSGSRWAIPSRREFWSTEKRWQQTDPERLAELTVARNVSPTVGSQGAYVPVVKLMRQTRRQHLGKARPGGLYFEFLTYWAFEQGVAGGSFAEIFATTLRRAADSLATGLPCMDPGMELPYTPTPEPSALQAAGLKFKALAEKAEAALGADRCPAAVLWREVLGANDAGQVFPLPGGCDERGRAIPAVTAVASRGSDEARGFA